MVKVARHQMHLQRVTQHMLCLSFLVVLHMYDVEFFWATGRPRDACSASYTLRTVDTYRVLPTLVQALAHDK